MRGTAYSTRGGSWIIAGRWSIVLLGLAATQVAAQEEPIHRISNSTVEVSIPSPRKRAAVAGKPTTSSTRSNSSNSSNAVARTAAYEPVKKSYATRSRPAQPTNYMEEEFVPSHSSSRMRTSRIAAYEEPMSARGMRSYSSPRMAMRQGGGTSAMQGGAARSRAGVTEEVMPGPSMGGEVISDEVYSDGYMPDGMTSGEVFEGDCGGDSCGGGCCDGGPACWDCGAPYLPDIWHHKNWGISAGAEALFVRPHFSQSQGLQSITGTQPGATALVQINGINWNNTYQGAFRGYIGLRNFDCGDEIRFSYWNLGTNNSLGRVSDQATNYCDFLCNQTANPGDVINTNLNLQVNVFDLDWIKPFCVPAPCVPTCDSCGDCGECGDCESCDSCGPCCPIWDVRWFAGIRFAQINHYLDSSIVTANGVTAVDADSSAKFFGIGPRMGMQVRRYFDNANQFSLYGRGSGSLLVGTLDQQINNFNITPPESLTIATDSFNRVIPVTEIEIGASWCFLPQWTVTGGWSVWSFWDLGLQERVTDFDTSNILGFDGFFVRLETVF